MKDFGHRTSRASAKRLSEVLSLKSEVLSILSSALAPTDLPLLAQVSTSEAGAEQLAYALRAHLDVGSAIIHDTIPLFESHGVRVIDAKLPDMPGSISLYDPRSSNFTVFIAAQFKDKPWRRDFLLLTEIGRAFIFCRHGRIPYHESKQELSLISRCRYEQFDRKIKRHYATHGHGEPMAGNRKPGRAFDLAALES